LRKPKCKASAAGIVVTSGLIGLRKCWRVTDVAYADWGWREPI
jgi:hypothetical protein